MTVAPQPAGSACDLLIRADRVCCPATGWNSAGDIAIQGDCIIAVEQRYDGAARTCVEFPRALLMPGLIDLHGHPARSGSQWGIDPDAHFLRRGTTTVLSQGDAGADTLPDYLAETCARSRTEVLLAVNLSRRGDPGPGGCCSNLDWLDVDACCAAIAGAPQRIWGISLNASHHCCGAVDPRRVVERALVVAEQTGLPLLYGLRRPEDWPLEEQLHLLRPGDVVTYCFRRTPHCLVQNGRVLAAVREARSRGVRFDVGHGTTSFDFNVAQAALEDGFLPDTISTDLQRAHLGQSPPHDLPLVMSKLRAVGMPVHEIIAATTARPAQILRREPEIGSITVGSRADLTVLAEESSSSVMTDGSGGVRAGIRWVPVAVVRHGELMELQPPPS